MERKVEHRIIRGNNTYNIQRKFMNGPAEIWITKRHKVNENRPGPFVEIDFLNTAVEHIRKEPNGKESFIHVSKGVTEHLIKLGFSATSISRILENENGKN